MKRQTLIEFMEIKGYKPTVRQRQWAEAIDRGEHLIVTWGRQSGKTWALRVYEEWLKSLEQGTP